jgi:hypothetical protein
LLVLGLGALVALVPGEVRADPAKCRVAIAKLAAAHVQARVKALGKCEERIVRGKLPVATSCAAEATTAAALAKAESKLHAGVARACGGADRACGNADDDPLAAIGWDLGACPDVGGAGCSAALSHCGDVADCLVCAGTAAVAGTLGLLYDDLDLASPAGSALERCQVAIGKETTKYLVAKTKALEKCWKAVNTGGVVGPCPVPGDGKAALKIARAESKKIRKICKACGGPDRGCDATIGPVAGTGGDDDLDPATIGFAPSCPAVTAPASGEACGGPVAGLAGLVACVDCIADFEGDCLDGLAVPWGQAYPSACNPGAASPTPTPAATPTPTATATADPCAGFLDAFDGTALDPAWSVLHPSLVQIDVSGGALHLEPTMTGGANIWFNDNEGPYVYKEISGDFTVTAVAHATDPGNPGQSPPPEYRLGGLLVRDPGSVAGARNSVHVAVGAGDVGNPVAVEDKTTTASASDFLLHTVPAPDVELRITRTGTTIDLYYREIGAPMWTLARSHEHPELPATVQVGMMAYANEAPPSIRVSFDEIACQPGS